MPTLAILVSFTIYNPHLDSYVSVVQLYERSSSQYMFASRSIIMPFKLSGFKRNDQGIMSIDVVRIILLCYILYLFVSTMVRCIAILTFVIVFRRKYRKCTYNTECITSELIHNNNTLSSDFDSNANKSRIEIYCVA